jgi:large subunit ribosomal protein L9
MKVNVFLLQDISGTGKSGDIISVKEGYAQNYLVNQKLGIIVTKANEKELLERQKTLNKKNEQIVSKTSSLAEKIKDLTIKIEKVSNNGEKLYGSVHVTEILEHLDKSGIKVNKSQIEMPPKAIKAEGTYDIVIKLTSQLKPHFKLKVVHK